MNARTEDQLDADHLNWLGSFHFIRIGPAVLGILFLSAAVFCGCSKQPTVSHAPEMAAPPTPSGTVTGFPFRAVQTVEAKEQAEIRQQALALLFAGDYDGLEALAAKHRTSRESYANGMWKLYYVYEGLELKNEPETVWLDRLKRLKDWNQNKPDSVTARVALGRFWSVYAWKARGGGWASTVTDEGWQKFGARLQKSAQALREAARMKEPCPLLWSSLQRFALGNEQDRSEYDKLFNQAIREFPDYEPFYNNRAIFLLPRWYGEDGELERDLEQSADRIGGEAGDIVYAQVVWYVHDYGSTTNVFAENHLSWKRTDRGFAAILKKFPDSLAAANEAAHLAALAGDPGAAQKYFQLTKSQVDVSQWDDMGQYVNCYKWAFRL